jgi:hypothetical protein
MRRRVPADPGALSGVLTGVSFVAGIGGAMASSKLPYPRPGATAADVRRYFTESAGPARRSAAGQLVSAASLGGFTLSVARLAGRSRRGAGPLRAAAFAGGGLAAASLATAGQCAAVLPGAAARNEARVPKLHRRAFLAGGPVHGLGFGVLLGALGLAGRRTGELPDAVTATALVAAVPNVLSPLYLLAEPAGWLIPIGRFPGLIVSGVTGARLARSH